MIRCHFVNKMLNLKAQIRELRNKDIERNKEGRRAVARKNQEIIDRFTGVVKYLNIECESFFQQRKNG